MSLIDHLTELRVRLIRVAIIIFVSFFICYSYGEAIEDFLLLPLRNSLGENGKIVYLGILDKVLVQFQLALWNAVVFSSPLWFYQIWLFIKPGLYLKEIKVIKPFFVLGFILFWTGVLFGYYVVFPFTFEVILSFGVQNVEASLSVKDYLLLSTKILFFLGLLFQLPNIMLILGFMGILSKKFINTYRRYIYVIFSIVSALLTPPDAFTMMALMIPLCILFEVGALGVAFISDPFRKKSIEELT